MNLRKTFSLLLIFGYLIISLFGLFTLSAHPSQMTTHCPYTLGTHSMCTMNPLEHIDAWKIMMAAFLSLISFVTVLLGTPSTLLLENFSFRPVKKRPERHHHPYVLLFSRGILNPKVF